MTDASAVSIRGLAKSFGSTPVLEGLDLDVPAGSIVAVLGSSGSGKTTLLRVLAGFERCDAGRVCVTGRIVEDRSTHVRAECRGIGYVAQEGSLFPHLTVRGNVAFGLPWRARHSKAVDELLAVVGLTDLARRYPHQLSGGQQQRVALARSLATQPKVVLLDEPFASLDANLRVSVRAEVCAILRRTATTAVLVTHDQDEALSTADLVAVLRDGRIVQVDAPHQLYEHPVDRWVATFVGDANFVAGIASSGVVTTPLGTVALSGTAQVREGAVVALVRPEQLEVTSSDDRDVARGRVLSAEFHGHDTTVRIAPELQSLPTSLVARVPGSFTPRVGDSVNLLVSGPVEAWADTSAAGADGNVGSRRA